jgi:DNA-binding PadR family transcriptional regulator
MRATALEMAVLGLLDEAPRHGYELRKQVTGLLGWGRVLSYGTLYPCLKALVHRGDLAAASSADEPRRRHRITYSLTDRGRERFTELVNDAGPRAWDDDHFGVHFAFFGATDVRSRVRILEGRRSRLEERLEQVRTAPSRTRGGRADPYRHELLRHGVETVDREVQWLIGLIDVERARLRAGPSPPEPSSPSTTPSPVPASVPDTAPMTRRLR